LSIIRVEADKTTPPANRQDQPSQSVSTVTDQMSNNPEAALSHMDLQPRVSVSNANIAPTLNVGDGESKRVDEPPEVMTEPVKDVPIDDSSADQVLEAALQEAVRAEADSHARGESDLDMEDLYAPGPNQLAPASSLSSAGEGKRSPVYSPLLERTMSDVPDGDSDNYEPPEATPPADIPSPIESPPFSPAPPDTVTELTGADITSNDSIQAIGENGQNGIGESLPLQNGSVPRLTEV